MYLKKIKIKKRSELDVIRQQIPAGSRALNEGLGQRNPFLGFTFTLGEEWVGFLFTLSSARWSKVLWGGK